MLFFTEILVSGFNVTVLNHHPKQTNKQKNRMCRNRSQTQRFLKAFRGILNSKCMQEEKKHCTLIFLLIINIYFSEWKIFELTLML